MKTNTTNELSCSVFGHNLERSSMATASKNELICKTCHSKVLANEDGEFDIMPFKNKDVHRALKQLFILKSQHSRVQFSA